MKKKLNSNLKLAIVAVPYSHYPNVAVTKWTAP